MSGIQPWHDSPFFLVLNTFLFATKRVVECWKNAKVQIVQKHSFADAVSTRQIHVPRKPSANKKASKGSFTKKAKVRLGFRFVERKENVF